MLIRQGTTYSLVLLGLIASGCGSDSENKRDAADAARRDGAPDLTVFDGARDAMSPAETGETARPPDASDATLLADASDAVSPADLRDLPFSLDGEWDTRDVPRTDGPADVAADTRDGAADRLEAVPPRLDGSGVDQAIDRTDASQIDAGPADVRLGRDARDSRGLDGASADTFVATLTGSEVVPTVRTNAMGTASFELSTAGTMLTYELALTDITATSVGLYRGAVGETGTQVRALTPVSGYMTGTVSVTAAEVAEISSGMWYLSVQSSAYPGGELRGQLLRPGERLWVAHLAGGQQVPPVASSATGHAVLILGADQDSLHYHIATDDITATSVRLQVGIAGQRAGAVAHELTPVARTMDGIIAVSATDVQNLLDHRWLVNVATAGNPNGELRGQVLMPGETLYSASLDGASETPPVPTEATGAAQFILDRTGTALAYEAVFVGLVATGAHIHVGASGVAGPVAHPLTLNTSGTAVKGSLPVTATDVAILNSAAYYINAHSAAYPEGEIRGQIARP